jgi:hypothetical protein
LRMKKSNDAAAEYRYRFVGDSDSHEVFDPRAASDFTPILISLGFVSDRPIRLSGRRIGQAIQTPRELAEHDARALSIYAKGLPRRVPGNVSETG